MTRHTKASIGREMSLPPRTEITHRVELTAEEKIFYRISLSKVRSEYEILCRQNRIGNRVGRVMQWIDALQRIALHPGFGAAVLDNIGTMTEGMVHENTKGKFSCREARDLLRDVTEAKKRGERIPQTTLDVANGLCEVPPCIPECPVCMDSMVYPTMLQCYHFLCRECILALLSTQRTPACPTCRGKTLEAEKVIVTLARAPTEEGVSAEIAPQAKAPEKIGAGTKAKGIVRVIQEQLAADPTSKFVVFSRFPQFLATLDTLLLEVRVEHCLIDGSTPLRKRAALIDCFQNKNGSQVCLITSRAGNAGLTLTVANHLILAEPSVHVAPEQQAMGRIHRLGQRRPVTVHRMVAVDTIEDRILELLCAGKLAGHATAESVSSALIRGLDTLFS
jgi:SNF2 family DNA or RNA helicase